MMDEQKKSKEKLIKRAHCVCNKTDGLFVPSRYLSGIIAGLMVLFFCTFIVGFFGGKRFVIKSFLDKTTQDSFGDQVYASLCALTDQDTETDTQVSQEDEYVQELIEIESEQYVVPSAKSTLTEKSADDEKGQSHAFATQDLLSEKKQNKNVDENKRYYAQLIGFGTLRAAQRCCQRLNNKGFAVEVKTRTSKTARGKHVSWYQVVTNEYENKKELENFVDRITQQEKISDIKITVVC